MLRINLFSIPLLLINFVNPQHLYVLEYNSERYRIYSKYWYFQIEFCSQLMTF